MKIRCLLRIEILLISFGEYNNHKTAEKNAFLDLGVLWVPVVDLQNANNDSQ